MRMVLCFIIPLSFRKPNNRPDGRGKQANLATLEKCTPSAFGISPEEGDDPMDLSTIILT